MIRNFLITCLLLIGFSVGAWAQDDQNVTVTGTVTDEQNLPMIGVSVVVQNLPGLGAITDVDGKYSISMPPYNRLEFSFLGYDKQTILVKEQRVVNVQMKETQDNILDEVVITGLGAQRKIAVTGAVTTVDVAELQTTPSTSVADGLAGVVPGIMAMQSSGVPGEVSEFWVRSISTFGANQSALVLVDGFERDINEVNVEDIESFTVLKDASATAIYGSKGANGVVLINTKRGKEGKINVNAKVEGFYNTFTMFPDFVDGIQYAEMANEAKLARNEQPLYTNEELEILRSGLDPDLYPNVDWQDVVMRDGAWSSRAQLSLSGGGKTARYFVSGSYQDQGGMYKTDESIKKYSTNANYRKWTYRMNVDIDITKSTLLKVGVSGSLRKKNDTGVGQGDLWTAMLGFNPTTTPITYSDGRIPADVNPDYKHEEDKMSNWGRVNPWTLATGTGYDENWTNNIQTSVQLEQNLDFITKGLRFVGRFGYDTENNSWINRKKRPELWQAENRDSNGELIFNRVMEPVNMTQSSGGSGTRNEFFEWELHYNRGFHDHHVGGTLKYTQNSKLTTVNIGGDLKNGLARRNQGLAGRASYNWKYRYFVDFNFGYTGSENFHKNHRWGFFPAASGAWNVAEEPFIKNTSLGKWINMFKIRYSWGKTGNDNLGNERFPYIYALDDMVNDDGNPTGGYYFNDYPAMNLYYGGIRYNTLASTDVTWEIATKQDLGVDFSFFNNKLTGSADYFYEKRDQIYQTREHLPYMVGVESNPKANVGSVKAYGFDGNFALNQKIGKVDFTVRGNMTVSKSEILEYDEENTIYTYKLSQGHRINQAMGLIDLGLFKDYDDIRNSPRQTWGDVMPGDIKYKDVNGDGIINGDDKVAIGATTKPNLVYGFGVSGKWKGLDVNVHFQGAGKSSFCITGSSVMMFQREDFGNIFKDIANSNRWILGVNEDPNAEYPRLTYGRNSNNEQASTFWLRDGSYLRLKTLDIGYSLPTALVNRLHMSKVRFYFVGTNLLTFSKFKLWDPEMGSTDGKKYPLSRTFSLGVQLSL